MNISRVLKSADNEPYYHGQTLYYLALTHMKAGRHAEARDAHGLLREADPSLADKLNLELDKLRR